MQNSMLGGAMKSLRAGDIVRLVANNAKLPMGCKEWEKTGIILDSMEMNDGFYYYECAFGTEIDWFQDLELELVES